MKATLFSFLIIAGFCFSAAAQTSDSKYTISLGPEYYLPVFKTAEVNAGSMAASLQGSYRFSSKLQATGSAGIVSVAVSKLYKELWEPWYATSYKNTIFFPVKGGLKYYITDRFYAAAEAGAAVAKETYSNTSFAYAGGIGSTLKISERSALDISAKYETWALNVNSTSTFLGLRAAYAFGF